MTKNKDLLDELQRIRLHGQERVDQWRQLASTCADPGFKLCWQQCADELELVLRALP